MARTPSRNRVLTNRQVIDTIMEIITVFPEQVADLPAVMRSRAHWEEILSPDNEFGAPVLAVLRELPAFTNQAPKAKGRAAWNKVFASHQGFRQVRDMLVMWNSIASTKRVKRAKITYWRDEFGRDEVVQRVRPMEHHNYIHNPHRGTTTFQRFQGEAVVPATMWSDTHGPVDFPTATTIRDNEKYIPRTTLTYCRWPWAWLEPKKGKFNWALIDKTLSTARAHGQTAQLRFQPYTERRDTEKDPPKAKRYPPGSGVNLPDWYHDTGAPWIDCGPYVKHEPDSNHPLYLTHFGNFIRAFAARYDGHPDLESIDMAYAGFWGESGGNATAATANALADIYTASFRKTQLLGMLGTPAVEHAVKRKFNVGWRADCFGDLKRPQVKEVPEDRCNDHTHDGYMREIYRQGVKDAWKTAPVTMETCGNVATWAMTQYDLDQIIEFGYTYHMSVFMPKSNFFPSSSMDRLIAFDRKIGYRYTVRHMLFPIEVARGKKMHVECYIENVGIAPIYRPYRAALRLTQGKKTKILAFPVDIRTWMPGATFFENNFTLPPEFERGEVKIALGIIDDSDRPCVWFAINNPIDDGWHRLTSIDAT